MTQQEFELELYIRIDDYVSINNIKPMHLLINPALVDEVDIAITDLLLTTNTELYTNEVVVF